MANTLLLKSSQSAGAPNAGSDVLVAEVALDTYSGEMYMGKKQGGDPGDDSTHVASPLMKHGGTMTGNIVMGDDTSIGIGDSSERIEFDGAGDITLQGCNVGIGTTAPGNKLIVNGGTDETSALFVKAGADADHNIMLNCDNTLNNRNQILFNASDNGYNGGYGESSATTFAVISTKLTQAGDGAAGGLLQKGEMSFEVNTGDYHTTALHLDDVATATFASHLVTGADKGLYFNSTFHTGYAGNDSTNTLTMATNNTARLVINDTSTTVEGKTYIQDGSVGAPGIAFESDTDTGIYRYGVDSMALVTAGASAISISAGQALLLSGEVIFQDAITSATSAVFSGTVQCATPTADAHAATRLYVDYTKYIRHYMHCGWNSTDANLDYMPLNGYIYERSSPASSNEYMAFCAPHDGLVEKVIIRSEEACGDRSKVGFHKSDEGVEVPNTTATESIEVDMTTDDTAYTFTFTGTASFDKGDVLAFSFDPASTPNDVIATIVLKFDTTT